MRPIAGAQQKLSPATSVVRVAIRLDLRRYAEWATQKASASRKGKENERQWRSIEQYIVSDIKKGSGGHAFTLEDLAALTSTEPVLIALDGLDEVANIEQRSRVSEEIVSTNARLKADARDLVVLVATRPGLTTSSLWSSREFPRFDLRRLSQGLRVQYLRQWSTAAGLNDEAADRLQTTFMDNHHVPHIRELASYPMQLAILLHLLYRRQLLPQQRTELYAEYLKTFLDREQSEDKEPLLSEQRDVIVSVHAYLGWYLQTRAEEGGAGAISRVELKALVRDHLEGQEYGQDLADRLFSQLPPECFASSRGTQANSSSRFNPYVSTSPHCSSSRMLLRRALGIRATTAGCPAGAPLLVQCLQILRRNVLQGRGSRDTAQSPKPWCQRRFGAAPNASFYGSTLPRRPNLCRSSGRTNPRGSRLRPARSRGISCRRRSARHQQLICTSPRGLAALRPSVT